MRARALGGPLERHAVPRRAELEGWSLGGKPASTLIREHWASHRAALYERVGLELGEPGQQA